MFRALMFHYWNSPSGPSMRPGEQLRELRNRLGVTTREVEEFSRTIAEDRQNEEFYISNAWLTQLENKNSIPSIYKLYSLSVIYRTKFHDLLAVFGIDLGATSRTSSLCPAKYASGCVRIARRGKIRHVSGAIRQELQLGNHKSDFENGRGVGEVPVALIQKLDVRHCQYGFIGVAGSYDVSAAPAGVIRANRQPPEPPAASEWRTEFDRPIFFVELRDGYACSWCEVRGSQLTLIPHPLSGCDSAVRVSVGG